MIPQGSADLLIGFEPAEAVRCLPYLREGGTVVVSSKAIKPVTASLSGSDYNGAEMLAFLKQQVEKLIVVDGEGICAQCGSAKVLNVALLGAAAASGVLGLTLEQLLETIRQRIPERFLDSNLKALSAGAKAATGE